MGELYPFPTGTMAIGRLDEKSEGLLILSTDGMISEVVRSKKVEKEYLVQLDGKIEQDGFEKLKSGVWIKTPIKEHFASAIEVKCISAPSSLQERAKPVRDERHGPTSWISITLREGKFRQVRKMTAAIGLPTLRLIRSRVGHIRLGEMAAAECLEVDDLLF